MKPAAFPEHTFRWMAMFVRLAAAPLSWSADVNRGGEYVVFHYGERQAAVTFEDLRRYVKDNDSFVRNLIVECIAHKNEANGVYVRLVGLDSMPFEEVIDLMDGDHER